MEQQEYKWLSAISQIAWRSQQDKIDDDPGPLRMKAVTGVAGSLHHQQTQAANELAAGLCLFLIVFILVSAKFRAILTKNGPVLCKIPGHVFLPLFWLAALKYKGPRDFLPALEAVPNQSPPHTNAVVEQTLD